MVLKCKIISGETVVTVKFDDDIATGLVFPCPKHPISIEGKFIITVRNTL